MQPKLSGADCQNCPGKGNTLIPSEPQSSLDKPRLIILQDGPSYTDVEEKKLLSAGGGRLLDQRLARIGLNRSDCHITSAVACYVPHSDKDKHFRAAMKCCAGRARAEVAGLPDDVPVMALGKFALQAAMNWTGSKSLIPTRNNPGFRGSVIAPGDPVRKPGSVPQMVLPVLHPNDVRQNDKWEPVFTADIQRVGRILKDGWQAPEHLKGKRVVVIQSLAELEQLEALLPDERIAFDIETNGLDLLTIAMVCFVLSSKDTAVVVPWTKTQCGEGNFFNGSQEKAVFIINELLKKKIAVTHNGALFDNPVAKRHGIKPVRWEDTLIGYHTLTSHFPKALSHVVACYVDAPPWKHWDHAGDLGQLWSYCGRDGLYTALAEKQLFSQMDADDWRVYGVSKNAAVLASEMTMNGFAFDAARAADISAALKAREDELKAEAIEVTGIKGLNLSSTKQLQALFFGKLGAQILMQGKNGLPSLKVTVLQAYAASSNPLLAKMSQLLLEYRGVKKCRGTFVDNIVVREDGRVHCGWRSYGTETGRWSCSDPNLATLPKPQKDPSYKAGLGGIRSLYIAPEGRCLVVYDVKQAEFKVAAYHSRDPNMIAVAAAQDIHAANAELLFGKAFRDLPLDSPARKRFRDLAKQSTFAVCYMAEAPTVHAALVAGGERIALREVEAMINSLRKNFRAYYTFCADNVGLAMKRGYVESPVLKRKRFLGYNPEPPKVANYPIQSGVADIYNLKMWEIRNRILAARLDSMAVASVYDSGMYDAAEDDAEAVADIIKDVWAEPVTLGGQEVVLSIDVKIGKRWSET